MFKTLGKILKSPFYSLVGGIGAFLVFVSVSLLPNYRLITSTFEEGLLFSLKLLWNLILSSPNTFGYRGLVYVILLSFLTGASLSVHLYYFREKRRKVKNISGVLGFIVGILGVGCASCGAIILAGVVGFLGFGSVLYLLPFGGEEFAWIGIVVVAGSLYFSLKKVSSNEVCEIKYN